MIPGYQKVLHVGHKDIRDLFDDFVSIEEKVDGSQFSFAKIDGELCFKSRRVQLVGSKGDKTFGLAKEAVRAIEDKLTPGVIYRGEYLGKPKHNCLAYDRVPKNNIIIWEVELENNCYLPYQEKLKEAERLGFECVPKLFFGKVGGVEELMAILDNTSILGGQKIEGFVVKQYDYNRTPRLMVGKYVSESFKEKHIGNIKNKSTKTTAVDRVVEIYNNENRWKKAVQHLTDEGKLEGSPKDIGALCKEVNQDVLEECEDEIKDILFKFQWGYISKGIINGLAQWYKDRLTKEAFNA